MRWCSCWAVGEVVNICGKQILLYTWWCYIIFTQMCSLESVFYEINSWRNWKKMSVMFRELAFWNILFSIVFVACVHAQFRDNDLNGWLYFVELFLRYGFGSYVKTFQCNECILVFFLKHSIGSLWMWILRSCKNKNWNENFHNCNEIYCRNSENLKKCLRA